jgi:MYXO-CTERM domain-containing protein
MNAKQITTAIVLGGGLLLTAPASADFVNVHVVNLADVGGDAPTYRVVASFDNPADAVLGVGAIAGIGALSFTSTSPLVNAGGPFAGLKGEDFAQQPLSAAWDSYVTIGASGSPGNDTNYSPGFAGSDGINRIIEGSSFSETNGGWYDSNPGTQEAGGEVLLAQFTLDGTFELSGVLSWKAAGQPPTEFNNEFFSVTPAPGALAFLGLAALAGARRRRSAVD